MIMVALLCVSSAMANRQRTTRKKLKPAKQEQVCKADTLMCKSDDEITLSGFDKLLKSAKETFFATNNTNHDITGIEIEITYTDMSGRMLHKRKCFVETDIPSGETRHITISTWDAQRTFYYYRSSTQKHSNGTPFRVKCKVLRFTSTKRHE